jgi:hypothetical protein
MIKIEAEKENYCLVTNGEAWTVVERRAGKYYPLGNFSRPGISLDEPEAERLFRPGRRYPERAARRVLDDVAGEWRRLFELIR